MSEIDTERQEAIIPDEELELDLNLDDTEDVEALKAELEKERAIRKQLLARAKKAEALKKEEAKPQKPLSTKTKLDDEVLKDIAELKLSDKKRHIGYKLGLSPEETDTLFRFAGGEDPEEAFNNQFFQAGLKEFRKDKAVQEAIPSSTSKARTIAGKDFKSMTEEERKANWAKITGVQS